MKKIVFLLFAVLPFVSCDDTETNDVSFQAKIDNRLYQATESVASVDDNGSLIIKGANIEESIILTLSSLKKGNFMISNESPNHAVYADASGNTFTTNSNGYGVVRISDVDEVNRTLTGNFSFSAILRGVDTVYVSKGVLHQVPFSDGNIVIPGEAGIFKAKVDGEPFVPSHVAGINTGNSIIISGDSMDASIAISTPVDVEAGEYTLPRGGFSAKYQDTSGPQTTSEGLLKIISHDPVAKTMNGTFSFITNLSEITEGEFEITYE